MATWPPAIHQDVQDSVIVIVGNPSSPITDAATARPTGAMVCYWVCALGVTPTNAVTADIIWNSPT